MDGITRCGWAPLTDPLYTAYHDEAWGVPVHDDLIHAWQALARWIDANGYSIAGPPSREFYLSSPGEPPVAEVQYIVQRQA